MADYNAARTVIDASRDELIAIFQWVQARDEDERYPLTVLIGGWAVYCCNQWYGSVDIDLITNSRARQHLMKYLRDKRGFGHKRHPMIPNTVVKHIPEGEILIDFGSREDVCRFEGRVEECPFSLLDGHTVVRVDFIRFIGISAFNKENSPFKHSKGSVQFLIDKPIPFDLVRKTVRFRVKENIGSRKKKK